MNMFVQSNIYQHAFHNTMIISLHTPCFSLPKLYIKIPENINFVAQSSVYCY